MSELDRINRKINIVQAMAPNRGLATIGYSLAAFGTLRMRGCDLVADEPNGVCVLSTGSMGEIVSWLEGLMVGMDMIQASYAESLEAYESMFRG